MCSTAGKRHVLTLTAHNTTQCKNDPDALPSRTPRAFTDITQNHARPATARYNGGSAVDMVSAAARRAIEIKRCLRLMQEEYHGRRNTDLITDPVQSAERERAPLAVCRLSKP